MFYESKRKQFLFLISAIVLVAAASFFVWKDWGSEPEQTKSAANWSMSQTNDIPPVNANDASSQTKFEELPTDYQTKELVIPELGLSFEYPDFFETARYAISAGRSGKMLSGVLKLNESSQLDISVHALTKDYEAPHGGDPTIGFTKRNGQYYFRQLGGQEELITYKVEEIQNKNLSGIVLIGDDRPTGPGQLGVNAKRAIFNLPNSQFGVIIFEVYDAEISDLIFNEIVESVKLGK